jgi:NADH:ubiquinone oxidoreductase subunit 4 (subunit M)
MMFYEGRELIGFLFKASGMLFLTGAIAIGGIPPLNGFISEFLIYCGILKGINSTGIAQITLMIITFAGLSLIGDVFESKIIDPLILMITRFINIFQFIQNGKIQAYVLYGIIFILVIFIGTVLNFWH